MWRIVKARRGKMSNNNVMDILFLEASLSEMSKEIQECKDDRKKRELEDLYYDKLLNLTEVAEKKRPSLEGPSFKKNKKFCDRMQTTGGNVLSFVKVSHTKPLLDYQDNETTRSQKEMTRDDICLHCGSTKLVVSHREASTVCTECGAQRYTPMSDDSSKFLDSIFSDSSEKKNTGHYSYKRSNHFSSWLARVQAKESSNIPQEVIDTIKDTLTTQQLNYKDPKHVTTDRIREILKQNKFPKYYGNVHKIRYMLTEFTPPQMTAEMEKNLLTMFSDITRIFLKLQKSKAIKRSNMLSYAYVLHKSCSMLGYDSFIIQNEDNETFKMLKHVERLRSQEEIWKLICDEAQKEGLGFIFEETIL